MRSPARTRFTTSRRPGEGSTRKAREKSARTILERSARIFRMDMREQGDDTAYIHTRRARAVESTNISRERHDDEKNFIACSRVRPDLFLPSLLLPQRPAFRRASPSSEIIRIIRIMRRCDSNSSRVLESGRVSSPFQRAEICVCVCIGERATTLAPRI